VASEIKKLIPRYGDIIIDAGGRDAAGLRAALVVADKLIVPFLAGQYDIWGVEAMNDLVGEAMAINDKLQGLLVLNKMDSNHNIRLAGEALEAVGSFENLALLDTKVGYRVAHRRSAAEGKAVTELSKQDNKAIAEMELLYAEVFGNGI